MRVPIAEFYYSEPSKPADPKKVVEVGGEVLEANVEYINYYGDYQWYHFKGVLDSDGVLTISGYPDNVSEDDMTDSFQEHLHNRIHLVDFKRG